MDFGQKWLASLTVEQSRQESQQCQTPRCPTALFSVWSEHAASLLRIKGAARATGSSQDVHLSSCAASPTSRY